MISSLFPDKLELPPRDFEDFIKRVIAATSDSLGTRNRRFDRKTACKNMSLFLLELFSVNNFVNLRKAIDNYQVGQSAENIDIDNPWDIVTKDWADLVEEEQP